MYNIMAADLGFLRASATADQSKYVSDVSTSSNRAASSTVGHFPGARAEKFGINLWINGVDRMSITTSITRCKRIYTYSRHCRSSYRDVKIWSPGSKNSIKNRKFFALRIACYPSNPYTLRVRNTGTPGRHAVKITHQRVRRRRYSLGTCSSFNFWFWAVFD
jgi:hypothetical protein